MFDKVESIYNYKHLIYLFVSITCDINLSGKLNIRSIG